MKGFADFLKTTIAGGFFVLLPIVLVVLITQETITLASDLIGPIAEQLPVEEVGGVVSALVFEGDPVNRAARGAVWGGTTGAVSGAIAGSRADKKVQQQREAELARLRKEIGEDAFGGLEALAECRHDVSLQQAAKAQQSENPNYALAGLWLEVLSYADQRDEAKARSLFPTLVEKDWEIKTEPQAEETMRKALNDIMDIRQEYQLPRVCK